LTRRQFRRDPTDALFAEQSQSILDNLVVLLRCRRAWNCSGGNAAALSGISGHSSEGNDVLDRWGSAIRPTADPRFRGMAVRSLTQSRLHQDEIEQVKLRRALTSVCVVLYGASCRERTHAHVRAWLRAL